MRISTHCPRLCERCQGNLHFPGSKCPNKKWNKAQSKKREKLAKLCLIALVVYLHNGKQRKLTDATGPVGLGPGLELELVLHRFVTGTRWGIRFQYLFEDTVAVVVDGRLVELLLDPGDDLIGDKGRHWHAPQPLAIGRLFALRRYIIEAKSERRCGRQLAFDFVEFIHESGEIHCQTLDTSSGFVCLVG